MSADTVDVGIIGLGRISGSHIQEFQACPDTEIVAICDIDPERVAAAQREHKLAGVFAATDWDELLALDGLDAVSIPLPDHLHRPAVLAAVAAGKHVLCEKPLGMNAVEAEEMLAATESAGVVHAVRMQRRHEPAARYVSDLVAEGFLGELRHFRARMSVHRISDPEVKLEWRLQADRGCYGVLGDLGAHALDLAHFTMGEAAGELTQASAMGAVFIGERESEDGCGAAEVTAWDAINFSVRYERNVLGSYQLSRFSPGYSAWEIDGQDACVRVRPGAEGKIEVYERRPRDDQVTASEYLARDIPDKYLDGRTLVGVFVEAILTGSQASPNFRDGLRIAGELDLIHAAALGAQPFI